MNNEDNAAARSVESAFRFLRGRRKSATASQQRREENADEGLRRTFSPPGPEITKRRDFIERAKQRLRILIPGLLPTAYVELEKVAQETAAFYRRAEKEQAAIVTIVTLRP